MAPADDEPASPVARGSRPVERDGLSTIPEAIAAIARGEIIIVVDDYDRENEGDFVMAADLVTPAAVNFMITYGRGLLCLPMSGERLDALEIGQMVAGVGQETNFTVSIDIERDGNTGISAAARAECIRRAVAHDARPEEFRRPGHVFPLRAVDGGVLTRDGHTEASVDLSRLAGLNGAGVICEIMNPDGTMARLPDLLKVAAEHALHLITIADLIEHRRRTEVFVEAVGESTIPTDAGDFRAIVFRSHLDGAEHLALVRGDVTTGEPVLVRLHSECLTGDVFGSLRCDCGPQLQEALHRIAAEGRGAVVYLGGHEGRGIGLSEKLKAYALQDLGHDTVEANIELGFPADMRDFGTGAQVLTAMGIDRVRLMTNNPAKAAALEAHGVAVVGSESIEITANDHNRSYLTTKRDKLGHELVVGELQL